MPRRFVYLLVAFALSVAVLTLVFTFGFRPDDQEMSSSSTLVVTDEDGTEYAHGTVGVTCSGAPTGRNPPQVVVSVGVEDGDGRHLEVPVVRISARTGDLAEDHTYYLSPGAYATEHLLVSALVPDVTAKRLVEVTSDERGASGTIRFDALSCEDATPNVDMTIDATLGSTLKGHDPVQVSGRVTLTRS